MVTVARFNSSADSIEGADDDEDDGGLALCDAFREGGCCCLGIELSREDG